MAASKKGKDEDLAGASPRGVDARLALFGIAYCTMHVGPVFLKAEAALGLTLGDGVSLLAPYVVLGAAAFAWMGLEQAGGRREGIDPPLVLVLLGGLFYTSGHGINLAANAIFRVLSVPPGDPAFRLTYFLDEHLGHVLWHLGVLGLSLGFLWAADRCTPRRMHRLVVLGAPAFAFAYFTDAVEGQTVPLLLPAAVLVLFGLLRRFRKPSAPARPVERFFAVGFGISLLLFVIWGLWQGGFPQFSEVWGL